MTFQIKRPQSFMVAAFIFCFTAVTQAASLPGPLVSSKWLSENKGNVTLLDVRANTKSFSGRGHISGAALIDFKKIRATKVIDGKKVPAMLLDKASFEKMMRDSGVSNEKPVVITYPNDTIIFATRLYWNLMYHGHKRIAILNGGNYKWFREKRGLDRSVRRSVTGDFIASEGDKALLATRQDVLQAKRDGKQLLDARSQAFYLGAVKKKSVVKAGHIPGAKSLPQELLEDRMGMNSFNSIKTLKQVTKALNVDESNPTITYCNSGLQASGSWFVMHELLGNKNVKLYDGSMLEWAADERADVVGIRRD